MRLADIPERWLRHIWIRQLFNRSGLATRDGRSVQVLFPGTPNMDAGPDFREARVRIGPTLFRGDVELHRDAGSWLTHGHQNDPHYNSVILHVVLTFSSSDIPSRTASGRVLPCLVLHPFLDLKLAGGWDESLFRPGDIRSRALPCNSHADSIPASSLLSWIDQLAEERFELHILRFEERLKELADRERCVLREPYPRYYETPEDIPPQVRTFTRDELTRPRLWEQLLYEGILEGLGYSKNREPFLRLARSLPLKRLRHLGLGDSRTMLATLFGTAGLLPQSRSVSDRASRDYVRSLRTRWKEVRPSLAIPMLHEAEWVFFRLRPSNFPSARIAAVAFLLPQLFRHNLFKTLTSIFTSPVLTGDQRQHLLHQLFRIRPDVYWSERVQFGPPSRQHTTIGRARRTDLLVNTVLPLTILFGRTVRNTTLVEAAKNVFNTLPLGDEDGITRLMSRQLLHRKSRLSRAREQQGLLQLYAFFCTQGRCGRCGLNSLHP